MLGVDGSIVGNGIDLLALGADFCDSVRGVLLQLLNDAVHDIDEDDLIITTLVSFRLERDQVVSPVSIEMLGLQAETGDGGRRRRPGKEVEEGIAHFISSQM